MQEARGSNPLSSTPSQRPCSVSTVPNRLPRAADSQQPGMGRLRVLVRPRSRRGGGRARSGGAGRGGAPARAGGAAGAPPVREAARGQPEPRLAGQQRGKISPSKGGRMGGGGATVASIWAGAGGKANEPVGHTVRPSGAVATRAPSSRSASTVPGFPNVSG